MRQYDMYVKSISMETNIVILYQVVLILCHIISCELILCHIISIVLILCHIISIVLILCHIISCELK